MQVMTLLSSSMRNLSTGFRQVMSRAASQPRQGRNSTMQSHPPAIFVADSLGLDFLNSIATPVDTPVDWIADGHGLLRWLAQARLVPAEALDELKARAMPGELDKVAGQARALREWFRTFVRK